MDDYLDKILAWLTSSKPVAVPVAAILSTVHEVRRLRAEVERLHTMSTVEMMCENYNVKCHIEEWEARCLKAENKVTDIESQLAERDADVDALKQKIQWYSARRAEANVANQILWAALTPEKRHEINLEAQEVKP